jgi:hypothetical protein
MTFMKTKFNLFSILIITFTMISCSGTKTESTEETAEETSAEETTVAAKTTGVSVTHDVADFEAWKKVYMEVTSPEERIVILQSVENPNTILVSEWTENHSIAKANFASEELKKIMADAGVVSEPKFSYFDVVPSEGNDSQGAYRLTLSHEVADFAKWKSVFDTDEDARAAAGLKYVGMSTDADNPNMVSIMFATDDMDAANEMMKSEELKTKMQDAGVISPPVSSWWTIAQ